LLNNKILIMMRIVFRVENPVKKEEAK